jgi:hypothetical protein
MKRQHLANTELKEFLLQSGFNCIEVALASGFKSQTVRAWVCGARGLNPRKWRKIRAAIREHYGE